MRIFASERVRGIMQALGMEKGEALVGADYRDRPDFWRLS